MEFKFEKLAHNEALITVEVAASDFEAAIDKAYNSKKGNIAVQGFRKGKAPRKIIEKMYGEGIFYEDAANIVIRDTYEAAAVQTELHITSRPEIDIVTLEKGEPFVYSAKVALKPEVKPANYKGLEAEKPVIEVKDEEVEKRIADDLEKNARVVTVEDRPVQDNDQAIIDFEGFIDGKPFEGGQGEEFPLIIGSRTFIDGFEEQIIGMKTGEEKTVNVTFPADYQMEELQNKPAEFKVTLKEIKKKEVPALDMEFIEEVSDAESVEAYKEEVRDEIRKQRETEAQTRVENKLIEKLVDETEIDISELMIRSTTEEMLNDFNARLQQQGLNLDQYLQFTGQTKEKIAAEMKEQAVKRIKTRLTLEAVVAAEGITATDEEYEEKLAEMAKTYQIEVDKMKSLVPAEEKEAICLDIAVQKAIDFVVENAVIK
ncbi:MAG: trigger factor [Eubacteriales bacterium]|nr:trigger factor [Eubacteriales bacterium]